MFLALALAAEERTAPRAFRPWLTGAVLVACFYTHVVPFAVGGCGAAMLAFGGTLRVTLLRLIPLALSALATIPWLLFSPAGTTLRGAAGLAASDGAEPHYLPWRESYEQIPRWLTEVWKGDWDQRCLVAWGALVVAWIVLGVWAWVRKGAGVRARSVALWLLPLACGIAYFFAPNGYRWIWP